jgi:hypothetical protein
MRLQDLKLEAQISPLPPVVLGGLMVVTTGLLAAMRGRAITATMPIDTQASAARARAVVIEIERSLGFLYSLNKADDFILALVEFLDETRHRVRELRRPFGRSGITTDFNGASVDFPFAELLARAQDPA